MSEDFEALILAGGGSANSGFDGNLLLYPLLGRSTLRRVVESVSGLRPQQLHIIPDANLREADGFDLDPGIPFLLTPETAEPGQAVRSALESLQRTPRKHLLVVKGNLPLVRTATLKSFLTAHRRRGNALTLLTGGIPGSPEGNRISSDEKGGVRMFRGKTASESVKNRPIDCGAYLFRWDDLRKILPDLEPSDSEGHRFINACMAALEGHGKSVEIFQAPRREEFLDLNDRADLAAVADALRRRKIRELARKGVYVLDPGTTWIDEGVRIGRDTEIQPSVIIEGDTRIGRNCRIQPFVHIIDSGIGDEVRILTSSVIEKSRVDRGARVGPFSRLRPNCHVRRDSRVGNFVEMKNTDFGRGAKAGHLSYIGDAEIGAFVNIGAGTITCNYDGRKKSLTRIREHAFIGSGTQLVAPVTIGKGAYVGAGSTITKDVPADALAVARNRQIEKSGWARRKRKD